LPPTPSPATPDRAGTGESATEAPSSRRAVVVAAIIAVLVVAGLTTWAVISGNDHSSSSSSSQLSPPRSCDTTSSPARHDGGGAVGTVAPDFALSTLDGQRCVTLSELRGRPVVLNFWASWCNPCRREFSQLRSTARSARSSGLEIAGVTYRDILGDARRFANGQHATWTLLYDPEGLAADAYGVRAIPQTLFIRRDGTVSARFYGALSEHDLRTELARIAA
jgi:cytochrome c biogenesis protein CcmG, thiol:disulfide interchange protein DsbE